MSGTSTAFSLYSIGQGGLQVTARRVAPGALSDADLAAWRCLAHRALEPNPFFEQEMLLPAAELYPEIDLLLVEVPGRLIGLMPVRRAGHWRKVPARTLGAWLHQDAFLGTPLLDPEAPEDALGAMIDAATDDGCGLLALEWFGTNGPAQRALQSVLFERGIRAQVYEQADRAALDRRPENDYLSGMLSKGRRREYKRLRRQLCEHLEGDVVVHDRAGDPSAVDGFLRAEASGWKGRAGTNFGATPEYTAFFRRLCEEFDS
jgi:hypothetical protein